MTTHNDSGDDDFVIVDAASYSHCDQRVCVCSASWIVVDTNQIPPSNCIHDTLKTIGYYQDFLERVFMIINQEKINK